MTEQPALAILTQHKGAAPGFDGGMRREADVLALLLATEDRREAGRAFREKHELQFKGE